MTLNEGDVVKTALVRCFGVLLLGAFATSLMGCPNDLYVPCQLDPASTSREQQECASQEGVTCSVSNFSQCDTRVCARYEGSDAFCTQACATDADCGEGRCEDFNIIQPGTSRFCVSPEAL